MPDPNITLDQLFAHGPLFAHDQTRFEQSRQLLHNVVEAVMLESESNFPDAFDRVCQAADWARSGGNPTLGGLLNSLGGDAGTKVTESLKLLDQQAEELAPLTDAQRVTVGATGVEQDKKTRKRLKRLDMPATEGNYRWALEQEVSGVPMPPKKEPSPLTDRPGAPVALQQKLAFSAEVDQRVQARMKKLDAPASAYPTILNQILSGEG